MNDVNFTYKNLTPFKWYVLENFPFIEADFDALTNWQLFCKLGREMNKIIDSTNMTGDQVEKLTNAFIELQQYVDNFFDNLNIQNEINNKLDQMAEDGTLAEIINEHIFGELNDLVNQNKEDIESLNQKTNELQQYVDDLNTKNYISLRRIGRVLKKNYIYSDESVTFEPYQMQGNCYCKNNIAVGLFLDQTRSKDTKGRLIKFNLTNMSEILSVDFANVGHGNWLSYNKDLNEIYITKGNTKDVIVVDFDTFNIVKTVNVTTVITDGADMNSFTYDNVAKKYYVNTYLHSYEIDFTTLAVLNTIEIKWKDYFEMNGIYTYKTQGGNIHNNMIYYTTLQPQGLVVLNLDGEIKQVYKVNNFTDPFYLTREPEEFSINLDNDEEIILGTTGQTCNFSEENISQFFKANLKYNYISNSPNFNQIINRYVYIDSNQNIPNPNGTEEKPFQTISEALDIVYNRFFSSVELNLADGNYSYFTLDNPFINFVTIEGNSSNPENVIINKFQCINGHLALNNVTIDNKYNRFNHSSDLYKSSARLINVDYKETSEILCDISYCSELIYSNMTRNGQIKLNQNIFDIQSQTSKVIALHDALLTKFIGYNFINRQKITPDVKIASGVVTGISSLVPQIIKNPSVKKVMFEFGYGDIAINTLKTVLPHHGNDSYRIDYCVYAGTQGRIANMTVAVTDDIEITANKLFKVTSSPTIEDVTDPANGLFLIAIWIE